MLTVYKYPFQLDDEITLMLPSGFKTLKVDVQRNELCLWALVDPDNKTIPVGFRIAGTGHPIEKHPNIEYRYVDTILLAGGDLVFHVFQIIGN
jgi:hypothetical protein